MLKHMSMGIRVVTLGLGLGVAACTVTPDGDQPDTEQSNDSAAETSDLSATPAAFPAPYTTYVSVDAVITRVIDIKDFSKANGARAQLWDLRTAAVDGEVRNQRWTITQIGTQGANPYYELKNALSGMCLDMANEVPAGNGVRVQQWDCNRTANQMWVAIPVVPGNRWGLLRNLQGNRCLDVTGASNTNGALLQVWDCSGNWNQRWNVDK